MTSKGAWRIALPVLVLLLCFSIKPVLSQDAPSQTVRIGYLNRADDAYYSGKTGYAGLLRQDRASPRPAAELAIKDSRAIGRAIGIEFQLIPRTLAEADSAVAALQDMQAKEGIIAAVLDLPADEVAEAAKALKDNPLVLLNARHRDTRLRASTCGTGLFHTLPDWAMLEDGLAQVLRAANWTEVLVLEGPADDDKTISAAFQASARKFGLSVAEVRPFLPGNDPRLREQINVRLLTGGIDHDVVFVADAEAEFGRYVPYATYLPRPVIGTVGLRPSAWHPYWERQGAPQLNRRFAKLAGRGLTDEEWASWVAVRVVVEATVRQRAIPLRDALVDPALTFDFYKGYPGSFRPWSHQLRQMVFAGTSDSVVATAPVEGVLHERNVLDTLGSDEPEFLCTP